MQGIARAGIERIRNSLAYRLASPCRVILANWSPAHLSAKPAFPITYLAFSGVAQIEMLRESIASLALAWDRLPALRIVGDGTLVPEAVRDTLKFWPADIEVLDWRRLVAPVQARGYGKLIAFAERVPMARKLVAVVASALERPTMYADTDVLWFRFPQVLRMEDALSRKPRIAMSPDYKASYDDSFVPSVLPHLARPPYLCAGILFANGDFLSMCRMDDLLEHAAVRGIERTEQTIFAEADHQLGGEVFSAAEFALFDDDRFSLGPSFVRRPWVARHYVGQVRHLFWRDALALRAGFGRVQNSTP